MHGNITNIMTELWPYVGKFPDGGLFQVVYFVIFLDNHKAV